MTKIIAIAALLIAGCVGPVEMTACGNACKEAGTAVKSLKWNGQCECYPPPEKICK